MRAPIRPRRRTRTASASRSWTTSSSTGSSSERAPASPTAPRATGRTAATTNKMGGPEMAPHTPQPLVAPRRSRGAPRPPTARRAPAKPWRASTPNRSSRPGEAVARLDPQPLVAPRRSRGAPRPPHVRGVPAKPGPPRYSDRLLSGNEEDPRSTDAHRLGFAQAGHGDREAEAATRGHEHRIRATIPNAPRPVTGAHRPAHQDAGPAADRPPVDPERTEHHAEHEERDGYQRDRPV